MKQHMRLATTLLGLAAAGDAALAGEDSLPPELAPPSGGCDWCQCLTGKFGEPLYQNDDAMLIQAVRFFGRAQVQFAAIDGEDVNGNEFSDTFEEIRRLRLGAEVKALKYFKIKANANFENDLTPSGGDRDIGYHSLDVALVTFDAGKLLGGGGIVDSLVLNYGRHKVTMGGEVHTSSNKIKTVERSAVANKVYPNRMTGVSANASKGNLSGTVGVFTTDFSEEFGDWNAGEAFYASLTAVLGNGDHAILEFLYNDANDSSQNEVTDHVGMELYEWALSLAYIAQRGPWGLLVNGTVGDNGSSTSPNRTGMFYGLVVMPSYWVIAEKLEAVVRYSLQVAEEAEGIRSNSRYLRRDHGGAVASGRGDEHHSVYGGLNYFLCGHNAKIMAGVEWETLQTMSGDVDALTWWLAWRMYF